MNCSPFLAATTTTIIMRPRHGCQCGVECLASRKMADIGTGRCSGFGPDRNDIPPTEDTRLGQHLRPLRMVTRLGAGPTGNLEPNAK
ncbi:hypothetical protein AGR4A_pAt30023 [Agrobacterium tumefaciens str. B6]|uniref:Uncharacterized protein n=1 Tax=Agrobacterium tumefaciens str. B6 TaxID=1183423 RepID=A0A822VBK7_AGRTU|nr:hypothetical protein AGR4A_pAt30023 [Agrobacterium tumefaciens str. B6]